jgi:hypothetical protein
MGIQSSSTRGRRHSKPGRRRLEFASFPTARSQGGHTHATIPDDLGRSRTVSAVMLADGGEAITDLAALRNQAQLFSRSSRNGVAG